MSVVYFYTSLRATPVRAQEAATDPAAAHDQAASASYDHSSRSALSQELAPTAANPADAGASANAAPNDGAPAQTVRSALSLASSGGVSAQAAALPGGAATQLGMGESFTTQLSTGGVTYAVPIGLPSARGHAQPNLSLSYNSGSGVGIAGLGWSAGAPAIERQTDRGLPGYDDRATWHANQDRFSFAGMELVPICTVTTGTCTGALAGETMPTWSSGWQYFRSRFEDSFIRFFWSPDHRTWRGQTKDGTTLELGVPTDGTAYQGALEVNPDVPSQIFRWFLVRQYDMQVGAGGQPVNSVVYRYASNGNTAYLTDIVDTSPAAAPTTTDLSVYAHHAVLTYATRPDVVASYRAGYRQVLSWRLAGVDVTSKPFTGGTAAARQLVRRYHLGYDPLAHRSLLTSVTEEGRCASAVVEDATQRLPATACPQLPPVTFGYQRAAGTGVAPVDGAGLTFEPIDTTVRSLPQSPPHSLDDADVGLMDINGDGLPDLVATKPGTYQGKHGLYLNGGATGVPGFGLPSVMPVSATADVSDAGVLSLHSPTVAALDFDSDGLVDLVHMPNASRYSVFSPVPDGVGGFKWSGREITTASHQNVKVTLDQDAPNVRVADVNGDGLVDIVYSSATDLQTFFSLGRYPGGDGQFGSATWTSATTATLSNNPVVSCPPYAGKPLRFSDPDVQLGDMNGDGLVDLVRVRDGEVLYWPGRGNGFWGTGAASGCANGAPFAVERHIAMTAAPHFGTYDPGSLLMNDVNGDGLSDIVIVRSQGVEIYLNDNGAGWTGVNRIDNTPFRSALRTNVRLTDINGSGTPDILWGQAGDYRYIDLTGGVVPGLLTQVGNGLGKTLDLTYTTSTAQMLAAAAGGKPWATTAPTVIPVLSRSTVRDHLEAIGRPAGTYVREYTYRDPVFEGRQREFRGFSDVVVTIDGDANSPTSYEHSIFQLGECSLQFVGTTADVCSPPNRWQDNWREPLKGLPVVSETYDANGVYLSSNHTTYELRQLYMGLDGRRVSMVTPTTQDQLLYDTASFDRQASSVAMSEVVVAIPGLVHTETRSVVSRATAGTARIQGTTVVDNFGNTTDSSQIGCVSGCPNGVDEVVSAHSDFALPTGDASGWQWRETHSYIKGSVNTAIRREANHTFDAFGNLLTTYDVLTGTLALDRHHAVTGSAVAPAPTGQSGGTSAPAQVLVDGPVYDAFGNSTFNRGPNGRCSNRDYDPDYAHLAVVARIAVGALDSTTNCGATLLSHRVTYDRGTNQVIDSFDARNQPTHFTYDGFGRFTSVTSADPTRPGQLATLPTTKVTYQLPSNASLTPYTMTDTQTQDGADLNTSSYVERQTYQDGLGRTIVSLRQADSTAGDTGDWTTAGYAAYDAKGAVARTFDGIFFTGTVAAALAGPPANTPSTSQQFDAFGRPATSYGFDHVVTSLFAYHALSADAYDGGDVLATVHQGTYATKISDGHGRTVQTIARIKVGATLEQRSAISTYLPTNELVSVTQRRAGSTDVVRTMQYDTMGRRVSNSEPNTTSGSLVWRYAYNDAGDVVGTSDARGCGVNYFYDLGGRLVAEDRSPCLASQAVYTAPNLATGDGTEAFYRYDGADPDNASIIDAHGTALSVDTTQLLGRISSVSGLGSKAAYRYDALGRITGLGLRVQKPGTAAAALTSRYAPRWYVKGVTLDAADRMLKTSSGAAVPELLGADGTSELRATYTKRGAIRQYSSSYGTLYAGGVFLADGRPKSQTLGDAAATHREFTYDVNLRPQTIQTYRLAAPLWSAPPPAYTPPLPTDDPTRQLMLENGVFAYDEVGNLVREEDDRVAADWPATAKPVTRTFDYDDLYRLTHTAYSYPGGTTDTWKSPFAAEYQTSTARPQPSPQVTFANRLKDQTFQYDWLGNLTQTTDDQQAFWDRSTGTRSMGAPTVGPNQLLAASNRTLAPSSLAKGDLSAGYDLTGNLTGLVVRRDGTCLPAGGSCWQRFAYEWDEVGELVHAQRWDLSTAERTANGALTQAAPARTANAELRYGYDPGGSRVLKTAYDAAGAQLQTLYVFSSLEVRSTTFNTTTGDYVVDPNTTTVLLAASPVTARIVYSAASLPAVSTSKQHVLLEFADLINSTKFIIDQATGELVEAATYQSYGAVESDYRPGRWGNEREPYKFSGKEEDIELGLVYFGARFYSPYLSTWISPDPVTIHQAGSDINPYAYVYGSPRMGVDADGRIAPLIIVLIIVAAALIAGGTSAATQANSGGWGAINWGTVAMAAGVGAVSAACTLGVGAVVAPAAGAVVGASAGAVVGAAAGGAAGGAVSYGLNRISANGIRPWNWSEFGTSMAVGSIAGAAGAGAGVSAMAGGAGAGWSAAAGGLGAGVGGYFGSVYIAGQQASWQSFSLSVGVGLAGALAGGLATKWGTSLSPGNASGNGNGNGPSSGTPSPGPSGTGPEGAGATPEEGAAGPGTGSGDGDGTGTGNSGGPIEPLGRGSTANGKDRWLPRNLREQLAVQQAMQNPTAGEVLPDPMGDARWSAKDGWVKMQQSVDSGGREGPQGVHYNRNIRNGAVDDFKLIIRRYAPPPDPKVPPIGPTN